MKKFLKWVLYIFIGLIVIGFLVGKSEEGSKSTDSAQSSPSEERVEPVKPQKEVYQTTARKLFNAYDENEVATDEEMKGKLVAVTGVVQSIDKDFTDSIIISLKTDNQFMPARLEVKDSEKNTALTLKKGKQVTIVCDRMSRIVGAPSGRNCTFN